MTSIFPLSLKPGYARKCQWISQWMQIHHQGGIKAVNAQCRYEYGLSRRGSKKSSPTAGSFLSHKLMCIHLVYLKKFRSWISNYKTLVVVEMLGAIHPQTLRPGLGLSPSNFEHVHAGHPIRCPVFSGFKR